MFSEKQAAAMLALGFALAFAWTAPRVCAWIVTRYPARKKPPADPPDTTAQQ